MATQLEPTYMPLVGPEIGHIRSHGITALTERDSSRHMLRKPSYDDSSTHESVVYSVWPRAHSSPNILRREHSVIREKQSRAQDELNRINITSTLANKPILEADQSQRQREGSLPRRRKISVPDIGVGLMTTVQEGSMDSPTIPGRPAINETPGSSPRHLGSGRKVAAESSGSSLSTNIEGIVEDLEEERYLSTTQEKADRRASSMLLPRGLAPLLIPPKDDSPPQVPPKSPRYLNKASPHSARTPTSASKTPISATSPLSMFNVTNSSMTSLSTLEGRSSPKRSPTPKRGDTLSKNFISGGIPNERISPTPWSTKDWRGAVSPSKHHRWASSVDEVSIPKTPEIVQNGSGLSIHQRGASETSILNRGRPTKRGDLSLKRTASSTLRSLSDGCETISLPEGFKPSDVSEVITIQEMRLLKENAEDQATEFEILHHKDVQMLSKELRLLEERCQYLRKTHMSLQEGRKNLHTRMISYLKSPRTATFSVDNMIKQEEALIELDDSIDDWILKLGVAEERRAQIQQKLLQHVAATLTLKPDRRSKVRAGADDQTPPRSPEKTDRSLSNERRAVESIRVYADCGVAALLAEIEREIDSMA